jgi:two-component system phosphate regulon sensor histidine kinase PhoR
MRTPLAAIRGYIETLLDGALDDDPQSVRRFLGIIDSNARRLTNIAADLLVLAKLESDFPALKLQTIAIRKSIESAVSAVDSVAKERGVQIIVSEVPDVGIRVDPTNLDHVLLNLLDNAVKFNHLGGDVHITVAQPSPDELRIEVKDTGVGIPSEEISRIFERFYRVDKARSKAVGGTGLGLSIVRHAVEQMGGKITVTSQLGCGSCFILTLPINGPASLS